MTPSFSPAATVVLPSANAGATVAEMAVDADEPGVLHQHFQAAGPLVLDADHLARRGGAHRRTGRSRRNWTP